MRLDMTSKNEENTKYKIMFLTNEQETLNSITIFLKSSGYLFTRVTNPLDAIELVKKEHFDMLVLDFIMTPINGDKVAQEIRKFNQELYILLLTGYEDLTPSLETIKRLDIQGCCEKSNKPEQILLFLESGIKSISQKREIQKISAELKSTYEKLEQSHAESIETVRLTVDAKDPYTRGHSDRVSDYSVLIGKKLNLPEKDIESLKVGGLFHDVGKLGVPDAILSKNDKLTNEEYSEIKNHSSIGTHILSARSTFSEVIPIVEHHHERYDGNGYPKKLKGKDIPYLARITTVADAFDAMNSKRAYRNTMDINTIEEEMKKNLGTQFDPEIGQTFLDILKNEPKLIEDIKNKYN